MNIGFIGLGRMGLGLAARLKDKNIPVFGFDPSPEGRSKAESIGVEVSDSISEFLKSLPSPRVVWIMVPQAKVSEVIEEVVPFLGPEDILIDGGNSHFESSKEKGISLKSRGVQFMDIGTSGGLKGREVGYCLMVGGEANAFEALKPFFEVLAQPGGYIHAGPAGAGHFVKMVHNAIEYGMMQAIGEGFDLLHHGPYPGINLPEVATVWNKGSIVSSFLMECTEQALKEDKNLEEFSGEIGDSGEGKWATEVALKHNVPFTVNSYALFHRYISRDPDRFAGKIIAALRKQFGGHTNKERA